MGVPGLWKLLESTGKPTTLESLQGKVLAIDLSLWIHQAMKGCAGRSNEKNGHLVVLFHRIAKLLFYGIKPIFVFDGPNVPEFKKIVLSKRQMKRADAMQKLSTIQKKILHKLAAEAVAVSATNSKTKSEKNSLQKMPEKDEQTNFNESFDFDNNSSDVDSDDDCERFGDKIDVPLNYDLNSEQFSSLPSSVQYDILLTMTGEQAKTERKRAVLPENSDEFSKYQLQNLLKKSQINEKLERVQKDLAASDPIFALLPETSAYRIKSIYHGDKRRHLVLRAAGDDNEEKSFDEKRPPAADNLLNKDDLISLDDSFTSNSDYSPLRSQEILPKSAIRPEAISSKLFVEPHDANLDKNENTAKMRNNIFDANMEDSNSRSNIIEKSIELETLVETDNYMQQNEKPWKPDSVFPDNAPNPHECFALLSTTDKKVQDKDTVDLIGSDEDDEDSFIEVAEVSPSVAKHLLYTSFTESHGIDQKGVYAGCSSASSETPTSLSVEDNFFLKRSNDVIDFESCKETLEELRSQRQKAEAVDKTLSSQIMEECEAVLKLFGMPYVHSPGEAEAQCAALERLGLAHGTVTDDSDIWLFGGKIVFRHVFNKKHFVHEFSANLINNMLGLTREKMIQLALLVGCDYTVGVNNVGVIAAIEILSEFASFDDHCVGLLEKFKCWWEELQTERKPPGNLVRNRLANLRCEFPGSFPDGSIFKSFLSPNVNDKGYEKNFAFQWNSPDLDGLRKFAFSTLGWPKAKTDVLLLPALKRFLADHEQKQKNQTLITNFAFKFQPNFFNINPTVVGSNRFNKAVAKLKEKDKTVIVEEDDANQQTTASGVVSDKKKRRKKQTNSGGKAIKETSLKSKCVVAKAPKMRSLPQQQRRTVVARKSKQMAIKKIEQSSTSCAMLSSDSD